MKRLLFAALLLVPESLLATPTIAPHSSATFTWSDDAAAFFTPVVAFYDHQTVHQESQLMVYLSDVPVRCEDLQARRRAPDSNNMLIFVDTVKPGVFAVSPAAFSNRGPGWGLVMLSHLDTDGNETLAGSPLDAINADWFGMSGFVNVFDTAGAPFLKACLHAVFGSRDPKVCGRQVFGTVVAERCDGMWLEAHLGAF